MATAQEISYKLIPAQYEFKQVKLNNKEDLGLFNDITEDDEGYLWISSTKGLHVFDGNKTITYQNGHKQFGLLADSVDHPFSFINKISPGNFWVQEDTGRFLLLDATGRNIKETFIKKDHPGDKYLSSAVNKEGELFMLTINNSRGTLTLSKKVNADSLHKLYETTWAGQLGIIYKIAGNNHWIWQNDHLIRISADGRSIKEYQLPFVSSARKTTWASAESIFFVDNTQRVIYTWNEQTDKIEPFIKMPRQVSVDVSAICIQKDMVILATNLYLYILDLKNKTLQDLSDDFIASVKKGTTGGLSVNFLKILVKKDGSILLSNLISLFELVKKAPPTAMYRQQVNQTSNPTNILSFRALAEDDNKNIYTSYYGGISRKKNNGTSFDPVKEWELFNNKTQATYSLHYWKESLIWNNVLINLQTGKKIFIGKQENAGHCTQYLQHDSLWLIIWGTNELHCYDLKTNRDTAYTLESSINNGKNYLDAVADITRDETGNALWISSTNEGISLITKTGRLVKRYNGSSLSTISNDIQELELSGNKLWFGCAAGLGVLNTVSGTSTIYKDPFVTTESIMQNRAVFSILPDTAGNFYLGSSYGLLYFDTHTNEFFNLPDEHPLASHEFNKMSAFRASDNRYYFGSTDGLFSFMPNELQFIKSSNKIKPIKLVGIAVFNQQKNEYRYESRNLNNLDNLILEPYENNIEFNFSVPEFTKMIYYSYRVKGQAENWSDYKSDNKILLYGLQPGNYILEVKASTSISDDNASYYSLPIVTKQVWYKKGWVIALFLSFIIVAISSLLRYRFNQKLQRQKDLAALRTKISSDLHDDVGTILSGLAMQSQVLAYGSKGEEKEQLNEISAMSRDAMEHMRDTVWAMDSRKDKFENLVDRMRAFAEKNLAMKNITHEFIMENIESKKFIDPEKRQNIYLIFKEAITNIIKHADAKHVVIRFAQDKEQLILSIHDNGTEKENTNSDGLGISNMKMRAEKIGGKIKLGYESGFRMELILE